MIRRPMRVLRNAEPEALEVFLGTLMLVFGVWLTVFEGGHSLHPESGHGFDLIAQLFGARRTVGAVAASLGGLQAASALFLLPHGLRSAVDVLCAFFYATITASIISWEWRAVGVPVYTMLAIAHAWVAWREWSVRRGR